MRQESLRTEDVKTRCTHEEKLHWHAEASKRGYKLGQWIRYLLKREIEREAGQ